MVFWMLSNRIHVDAVQQISEIDCKMPIDLHNAGKKVLLSIVKVNVTRVENQLWQL